MGRRSRSSSRSRSRSRSGSSGSEAEGTRIHVGDLSANCNKRDLENAFEKFGRLVEVWMARTPPCFAFIVYQRRENAEEAVRSLNGQIISGSRIRVSLALPRARQRRRRATFDSNMKCYQCGERGHFARDCHTVGRNRNRWSPHRRSRSPRRRRRSSSSRSSSRSRSHSRSRGQRRSKHGKSEDKERDSKRKKRSSEGEKEKGSGDGRPKKDEKGEPNDAGHSGQETEQLCSEDMLTVDHYEAGNDEQADDTAAVGGQSSP